MLWMVNAEIRMLLNLSPSSVVNGHGIGATTTTTTATSVTTSAVASSAVTASTAAAAVAGHLVKSRINLLFGFLKN